jgi:glyoxylase-like metal-dependent hydrolase (beta-lactamase superfamily II)
MPPHTFSQISPHVYWLSPDSTTDRPILGAIVGARGTLLVDAGNSPAHVGILLHELSKRDLHVPTFLALTHWHWDHVFGASALAVPAFAHVETQRIVTIMAGLDWSDAALDQRVVDGIEISFCRDMIKAEWSDRTGLIIRPPDIGFVSQVDIDLGGVTAQLVHVGGDHSPDSSIVYVPEDKIMFLGDCTSDDLHHGPRRVTTTRFLPLLDRLLGYDAEYYLHSHAPEPLSRKQMADDTGIFKAIGHMVEACGEDRAAVLAALPGVLKTDIDDEHIDIVDAFLAGYRLPVVTSVL